MIDHRRAAEHLLELADNGELDSLMLRHDVGVFVLFGSASRPGPHTPNDLDLAVIPNSDRFVLLQFCADLAVLLGPCELDVVDLTRSSIVLRAEALVGTPLYENEPDRYAHAQMRAAGEQMDTAWFRRLDLELMAASGDTRSSTEHRIFMD